MLSLLLYYDPGESLPWRWRTEGARRKVRKRGERGRASMDGQACTRVRVLQGGPPPPPPPPPDPPPPPPPPRRALLMPRGPGAACMQARGHAHLAEHGAAALTALEF
eukprot:751848-Hanusia_phi.AAC.2